MKHCYPDPLDLRISERLQWNDLKEYIFELFKFKGITTEYKVLWKVWNPWMWCDVIHIDKRFIMVPHCIPVLKIYSKNNIKTEES